MFNTIINIINNIFLYRVVCIVFLTCIMLLRSIDGTYDILNGIYTNQLATNLQPSFDDSSSVSLLHSSDYGIVLACTLCTFHSQSMDFDESEVEEAADAVRGTSDLGIWVGPDEVYE
jgi:hypothetical protein